MVKYRQWKLGQLHAGPLPHRSHKIVSSDKVSILPGRYYPAVEIEMAACFGMSLLELIPSLLIPSLPVTLDNLASLVAFLHETMC